MALLSQFGLENKVIIPDKGDNTTEMVYISDAVILHSSTTGQEAIAFHKPLIIMDFATIPDYARYVEEGVGIPVFKTGILADVIRSLMNKESCISAEIQDNYVHNHMYKIDGLSTERISNIVLKQIRNNS